jgi:Type I restriction-modification system methyltransferase subunit
MNKQQLASKIWEAANQMRSKIEANEYKDYILGFIFYKFLSDKEVKFLRGIMILLMMILKYYLKMMWKL